MWTLIDRHLADLLMLLATRTVTHMWHMPVRRSARDLRTHRCAPVNLGARDVHHLSHAARCARARWMNSRTGLGDDPGVRVGQPVSSKADIEWWPKSRTRCSFPGG